MLFLIVNIVGLFSGRPVETQILRLYLGNPSAVSAVLSFPLIVAIRRRARDEQPCKRELPCDSITVHHLLRDVQIHTVVVLVCVIQGTVRHEEEILGS